MSPKKIPTSKPNPNALNALMDEWPTSWAGLKEDYAPGQRLVAEIRPFITYLIDEGLAAKTIRRHLNSLWAIGGEIIRQFNDEPVLRHSPAHRLLLNAIDAREAPLLPNATEDEQRSADATARKLLKFLLTTK